MTRVRLTDLARGDLAEIRHYAARDKPVAANRLIASFFKRFHLLAGHPELGQEMPELGPSLRTFAVGGYVIVYRRIPEGVEVVRVVSGYRDLDALF